MGIVLIVMMFVAMLLLGWWEIRRSRRRFREAKQRLNTIYGDVKDQPDSEKSIQADILRESSQAVDSKTEKTKETSTSANQTVVVYGDSGTGKSAFFSRILDTNFCRGKKGSWLNLHNQVLARHICRVQDDDSLDPIKWVRSLAGQIFSMFSHIYLLCS